MALITGRELAVKVIDQVTKHPETHLQSMWISGCGTTACIAGWAVALNREGGESIWDVRARVAAALFGFTDEDGRHDQDEADRIFMCMDETEAVTRLAGRFDIELPEGYNA